MEAMSVKALEAYFTVPLSGKAYFVQERIMESVPKCYWRWERESMELKPPASDL